VSPEYKYQPRELYAPVDKTGASSTDLPKSEQPRQTPPAVSSPDTTPLQPAVSVDAKQLEQSDALALGNQEASGRVFTFSDQAQHEGGLQRRRRGEQSGSIPLLAGGAPKRIDLPANQIFARRYNERIPVKTIAQEYDVSESTIYRRLSEELKRQFKDFDERSTNFITNLKTEVERLQAEGKWPKDENEQKRLVHRMTGESAKKFGLTWIAEAYQSEDQTEILPLGFSDSSRG
jgi:hypothetical protein